MTQTAATDERLLRFGWFIPTMGDETTLGDRNTRVEPSMELFLRIARAVERAGFEYALVPVAVACWDAWIACSMIAAQTTTLKPLVAVRPGYIQPTQMAKMIATFDQLTGGRVFLNLIAGGSAAELAMDGVTADHDERYELMDEGVQIMKRVWSESEPVTFQGKHFQIENSIVRPRVVQSPHPPFFIGGESDAAREVGAKHADVFLFWGDTPEKTAEKIADIRARAERYGRAPQLGFGMRLQVIVRDTEEEAWAEAWRLIGSVSDRQTAFREKAWEQSEANTRMWELTKSDDHKIAPHLWSGISTVRVGAGVAVVGDPRQVAATLQQFVDVGCTDFCLSGYPHDVEAQRFGEQVMPYFAERLALSMPRVAG